MKPLTAGDTFRLTEPLEAIHLSHPMGGHSMGYHAPADVNERIYNPELLGDKIIIPTDDTLTVKRAYESVGGWCVHADWKGHEIHLFQTVPFEVCRTLLCTITTDVEIVE